MGSLKKHFFWIVIGVVALGAVVFLAVGVGRQTALRKMRVKELEDRQAKLKTLVEKGDKIPNRKWIDGEKELAKFVDAEIKKCQGLVVHQRRNNHVQLFWSEDDPLRKEVETRSQWLDFYFQRRERMMDEIEMSRLAPRALVGFPDYWGGRLPTWDEIRNAQVNFWLRKDIIDILTNQAEKDVLEELKLRREEGLQTLLDVVENRSPGTLSKSLEAKPAKDLAAILRDILINPEQSDLMEVLSRHGVYEGVIEVTIDSSQQRFLRDLRSKDKDRSDLAEFVMDIRMVRFRDDLIDLFKNHNFADLSGRLRTWTPGTAAMLAEELNTWQPARLASAIEAAISIVDDVDMNLILWNHRVRVAAINGISFEDTQVFEVQAAPAPGQPAGAAAAPGAAGTERRMYEERGAGAGGRTSMGRRRGLEGVYNAFPFMLSVTMEFRHIPVLMRRLLMSDWRVEIQGFNIIRTGRPAETMGEWGYMMQEELRSGAEPGVVPPVPGRRSGPLPGRGATPPAALPPGRGVAPPGTRGMETTTPGAEKESRPYVAPAHYIKLDLRCEARQFYPLWKAQNPEEAKIIEARLKE